MLDDRDVAAICADESRLYRIVARENAFCRAVRTGDDAFWLPLQIQWVLPSLIAANGLTIGDTEAAWLAFREAETNVAPSLRKAFIDYYGHHFPDLQAGTPVQLELSF